MPEQHVDSQYWSRSDSPSTVSYSLSRRPIEAAPEGEYGRNGERCGGEVWDAAATRASGYEASAVSAPCGGTAFFHIRRILCLVLTLGLRMSSYEDLFESSVLEVIAPPPSLGFPSEYTGQKASNWIARLREPLADRKTAFFGMYAAFL